MALELFDSMNSSYIYGKNHSDWGTSLSIKGCGNYLEVIPLQSQSQSPCHPFSPAVRQEQR